MPFRPLSKWCIKSNAFSSNSNQCSIAHIHSSFKTFFEPLSQLKSSSNSAGHFIVHHTGSLPALGMWVMTTAAAIRWNGFFWTIAAVYRNTISCFQCSHFFSIPRYNDFNIPLTVSLLVCWAGSRRFHQQSCAWHSSSKVCPGKRQLYTHLHLLGMPTGWTSTSSYPHCYFWLAYNASITSLSLNRKATTSFVSKATMKSAGGRSKLVWQQKLYCDGTSRIWASNCCPSQLIQTYGMW